MPERTANRLEAVCRDLVVARARLVELGIVAAILEEASAWADAQHGALWTQDELDEANIRGDIERGEFFLGGLDGSPVATIRFQLDDREFWPDARCGEAAYVHRLAVYRRYAGRGIGAAMLAWAAQRAHAQGRRFLRLDADLTRPKLRAMYERCGFRAHSERAVGPYRVMRYEMQLD